MIIRKTNKQTAVWALLTLVLTAVLLTGCEAPQGRADLQLHRLHFLRFHSGTYGSVQPG